MDLMIDSRCRFRGLIDQSHRSIFDNDIIDRHRDWSKRLMPRSILDIDIGDRPLYQSLYWSLRSISKIDLWDRSMRSLNWHLESIMRSIMRSILEIDIWNWFVCWSLYLEINLWDQPRLMQWFDKSLRSLRLIFRLILRLISKTNIWIQRLYRDRYKCRSQISISLLISKIDAEINAIANTDIDLRDQFQRSISEINIEINTEIDLWDCYLRLISIS